MKRTEVLDLFVKACKKFFDWDEIVTCGNSGTDVEIDILIGYIEEDHKRRAYGETICDGIVCRLVDNFDDAVCYGLHGMWDKKFCALVEEKLEMPIDDFIEKYYEESDNEDFDYQFMDEVKEALRPHIIDTLYNHIEARKEDIIEELHNREDEYSPEYVEELIRLYF